MISLLCFAALGVGLLAMALSFLNGDKFIFILAAAFVALGLGWTAAHLYDEQRNAQQAVAGMPNVTYEADKNDCMLLKDSKSQPVALDCGRMTNGEQRPAGMQFGKVAPGVPVMDSRIQKSL